MGRVLSSGASSKLADSHPLSPVVLVSAGCVVVRLSLIRIGNLLQQMELRKS